MNNFELLSGIIRGVWAIDEEAAQSYLPLLSNVLKYKAEFEQKPDNNWMYALGAPEASADTARYSRWDGFNDAPKNSVAIINIKGALMKGDQSCGPRGMQSIGNVIRQADDHHNIAAIVLHMDTPGGTVDGTETLASIVKNTQKPVIVFVDGMMASAGVWIGSGANEVIASNDMDRIGSVGVMMSFADVQPALKKMGVKFHTILADQSKDKNRIMEDVRKGEYKEYRETILNPLADRFGAAVRENFPNVEDRHVTGSMFFAKDLLGTMVNSIGTFDDAVDRALELAQDNSPNTNTHNSMKQFNHINAALGVDNLESAEDTVALNEEQLEALDTALGNQAQTQTDLETAQQAQTDAETAQHAAETERDELQTRVEELEGSAGSKRTTAQVEADKKKNENAKDDDFSHIASAQKTFDAISAIDD